MTFPRLTHPRHFSRRAIAVACVAAAHLALSPVVSAQPRPTTPAITAADVERARALKARGDEAMDAFRYGDALAAYQQAHANTKDPALLYNQARAQQALADFAASLDLLERFDAEASPALKARVPKLRELTEEVRARVTRLTVVCDVKGAQVVLNDRVLGATPLPGDLRTSSGRAALKVTADGYEPYVRQVDLPGGGAARLDVHLVAKDRSAVLVIRANTDAASVWLDGKPAGQAPLEVVVGAGSHLLRLARDGYEPTESSVVVAVGERKETTVTLVKPPPITAKWWFWTSVGLVVVAGVITVVALSTERGADQGSVSPGRVSAPLLRW